MIPSFCYTFEPAAGLPIPRALAKAQYKLSHDILKGNNIMS